MIKKVRFPDSTEQEIQDSRIDGIANTTTVSIDSTPTSGSGNLVTSGGVKTAVDAKQDTLVSGTNIKTVNSESLLGSGNIGVVSAIGTSGNNLTYTKNGTTSNVTVPYATKAEKDTAGLVFRDAYFRSGLMFSPTLADFPRLYSTQTNNAFYALNKRKTVTATGFTAFNAASIFNNDGNTLVNYIPAAGTGVITIGSTTDNAFTTYTYGKIYMRFYVESTKGKPSSVSIRAYGTKSGTVGWYNYTAGAPITTQYSTEATNVWYCDNTNIYNIKAWEITIVAHETLPTYLSEVVAIFTRSNGEVDQSAVTKFANDQTLYGAITIDNTLTATGAITGASIKKSGGTSSQFLKADGSVDSTSYGTYSKPSGGIPASDLASGVIPDVSGKENTSNKVTSLSSSSTDTQYPSAKCVYDAMVGKLPYILTGADSGVGSDITITSGDYNGAVAAVNEGRQVVLLLTTTSTGRSRCYDLYAYGGSNNNINFQADVSGHKISYTLNSSNQVTNDSQRNYYESTTNKVTTLSGSDATTKYPTVSAVNGGLNTKQDTLVSGTNIKTINGSSVLGNGNLSTLTPIVNHGTSDTTFAVTPNTLHVWGTVGSLTLTLATPTDNTIVNEYMIEFVSGSTATTLSMPSSVEWAESCGALSVEASKTYQISIVNNIGLWAAIANS